jgi:hypothetical protein
MIFLESPGEVPRAKAASYTSRLSTASETLPRVVEQTSISISKPCSFGQVSETPQVVARRKLSHVRTL